MGTRKRWTYRQSGTTVSPMAMVDEQKRQAEALAISLEKGVTTVADVIAWADGIIAKEKQPHSSVCELASMVGKHRCDVVDALRALPGQRDAASIQREVFCIFAQTLAADRSRADKVASALFHMAMDDELPAGELSSLGGWAWDALSLADDGISHETRDQVVDQILDTLQHACES